MRTPIFLKKFHKELDRCKRRSLNMDDIKGVMTKLIADEPLDARHRNHLLVGNYANCWECHVRPDWLLIYTLDDDANTITFLRTGTHSNLF